MVRFAQGTAAHLWIATLISLCYSSFTWFLRVYARISFYGADDAAITVAHLRDVSVLDYYRSRVEQSLTSRQLTALAQWISVIVSLDKGFGQPEDMIPDEQLLSMSRAIVASQIFYLMTLGISKISLTLLMRRIFSTNARHKFGSYVLLGVTSTWLVLAIVAVKANCPSTHILQGREGTCYDDVMRWKAILAINICIEAAVMGLPVYLVSHLHIKLSKKMLVVSAFVYRVPLIVISLFYLRVYTLAAESKDNGNSFAKVIIWQQASLCYSLLSATLPFVQAFMRGFTTGGTAFGSIIYGSRNSRSHSSGGDTSGGRSRGESFTPQFLGRTKTVCRGDSKNPKEHTSRGSSGSQELMVRREVTLTVSQN